MYNTWEFNMDKVTTTKTIFLLNKEATISIESTKGYILKITVKFNDNPLVEFAKYSDDSCSITSKDNTSSKLYNRLWLDCSDGKDVFALENCEEEVLTFHHISKAPIDVLEKLKYMKELKRAIARTIF